jgi:hypothetical protein
MSAIPLLLLLLLPAEDKPTPKLPLGKETTYITEPLDKDGYLDYESALNDRLGKGITSENNANVLLWKALGPRPEGGKGMPEGYFKRLGIKEPPENGDYFIGYRAYLKDQAKVEATEIDKIVDQPSEAARWPWTAKDYPHLAAWLAANEKPLVVVVEATRLPEYYNPLVSHRSEKVHPALIAALLPSVQKCRQLTNALAARAMLRVADGKFDDAWQDLLACHRLGRLLGRGSTLIEGLVGLAINNIAANATLAYLERANLNAKQAQERIKDLQALAPIAPMSDKVDLGERFVFLDIVQIVRCGDIGTIESLGRETKPSEPDPDTQKALETIDWDPVLRNGNKWYDRMAAAMRLKDRADREKEFDKIEVDLKALRKDPAKPGNLGDALHGKGTPKEVGTALGNVLVTMMMPATRKVQNAADRSQQVQANLQVAFALAAYHADHKSYPAKLNDLAPKYLAPVPDDLFSSKPLIYGSTEKGYLFYSIGVNGKDEEGRSADDDPAGDDIGVRMPLPERKRRN